MLDNIMGTSDLLMSVAPIRIMVTGGVVAVVHLHTRSTTEDLDFILDPNVDAAQEYREEFFQAVKTTTAVVEGLPTGWLNDHMRVFIRPDKREELFLSSVEQDLVIYRGGNLVAYATRLDWALETKLGRIETLSTEDGKRAIDISDAVELIRLMIESKGGGDNVNKPISTQYLRSLNFNNYKVQSIDQAIAAVTEAYKEKYGKEGIE